MSTRFNILSLSGGGFLGLYTISVIAALEEHTGKPIARHFDLIAGTSIGGILALGLANEVPAKRIKLALENNGIKIFPNKRKPATRFSALADVLRRMLKPKYRADALREVVGEVIGKDTRIGDLKHRVIVPTVNLTKGRPQIFKTPHHSKLRTDLHLRAVDIAVATAAAPTYFPIAEVGDSMCVDGGLFANSPDLLAMHEAEYYLGQNREQIHLLSIGTTTSDFSLSHEVGTELGILGWARNQRLVSAVISSQQYLTDYILVHQLGDRYLRMDAHKSMEQEKSLGLDIATTEAQKTIRGLASATIQAEIGSDRLKAFLAHEAPSPTFLFDVV